MKNNENIYKHGQLAIGQPKITSPNRRHKNKPLMGSVCIPTVLYSILGHLIHSPYCGILHCPFAAYKVCCSDMVAAGPATYFMLYKDLTCVHRFPPWETEEKKQHNSFRTIWLCSHQAWRAKLYNCLSNCWTAGRRKNVEFYHEIEQQQAAFKQD